MTKEDNSKVDYLQRVQELAKTYKRIFLVNIDNVTSDQMHQVRKAVRGQATILLGKNTLIRKALRECLDEVPEIEPLLPLIKGNVGLVFTNSQDLKDVRDKVTSFRVAAPAKTGVTSTADVVIPPGPTSILPEKTSFFQALGISTKLVKGCIEITAEAHILKKGQVVNASQVEFLSIMGILPFSYGITVLSVYDNGSIFESSMLDISEADLIQHVCAAIKDLAAISLATHLPSVAAVPHLLANAFKDLLAVGLATEVSFPAADRLKEALKAPRAVAAVAEVKAAEAPKAAAAPSEESDDDAGFGLFD